MRYGFICKECNEKKDVYMSIKDYHTDGHKCDVCGNELVRDYEDIAQGAIWNTSCCGGGFNVNKC